MNILIVNTYFSYEGGAEIVAYNTFKLLQKNGHNVYFFSTDKKPYIEKDYQYAHYFTNYNGGIKNFLKNPIRYFYNKKAISDLNNFIKYVKPDIIHIHGRNGFSPFILSCCKDVPTIMTVHDAGLICPSANLLKNNQYLCMNYKCCNKYFIDCIKNKCEKKSFEASIRRSLWLMLFIKQLKFIDKFLTPSEALRKVILNAEISITSDRIRTLNNCLTEKELNILPNYANKGYFLYIGRLSKEKGVNYLLQAIKDLPQEIEFHIVGTGTEENNLKQYAKENNLNNVKFQGFKTGEEVKNEYQNCIATILPCNWFEIFGMTNIESFVNGKPVIASNIGGIPEIVEDNINGLLFEPANVEQLKECILAYWNNPNLVIEHGKNGYQKVITQYTEEKYYKELMNVYEEIINDCKK